MSYPSEVRHRSVKLGLRRYKPNSLSVPTRLLDCVPGCLVWVSLTFCVVGAILFPHTLQIVAALFALYTAMRFVVAGFAYAAGMSRIHASEQVDWHRRYCQEADANSIAWGTIHHLVIIPNFNESTEILGAALERIACSPLSQCQITIVLAMEGREDGCIEKAELLKSAYAGRFAGLFYTVHPVGLPGELACKSANMAWAARWISRNLWHKSTPMNAYDSDRLIVTAMDADTLWHPQYFSALTYYFAVDPHRYARFWQAPVRYHSNVWAIHPILRLLNAYSSAFELAYLSARWWLPMPFSSYSLSYRLLERSGHWDTDVITDDWHMYIKAFFGRKGDLSLTPIYLPFLAYATTGETFLRAALSRYHQTLRHAWGSKEVGFTLANWLGNSHVPYKPTANLLFRVSHDVLHSGSGWLIVTLGAYLPLVFHPDLLPGTVGQGGYSTAGLLLQVSFGVLFVLGGMFWFQDLRARPPRQHAITLRELALTLLGLPLLPLLTMLFVALPVLHAQTRLMLGVPLEFRVSRKI